MSETRKIVFGTVNDTDESLKSKSGGGQFGLNKGLITKFEFNPNAGADNSPADAVEISVMVGEREFNSRIYDVTRVYDRKGNEITDTDSEEYIKRYNENIIQAMAVIVHIAKSLGVTQQQLDTALSQPKSNFADWARTVISLVPAGFEKRPVDVFLEWQWTIPDGESTTYLQLPRNMKGGRFLSPHIVPVGKWTEEKEWEQDGKSHSGLRYVDDSGVEHPFTRNQNFMESPKAIRQSDNDEVSVKDGISNSGTASKSYW